MDDVALTSGLTIDHQVLIAWRRILDPDLSLFTNSVKKDGSALHCPRVVADCFVAISDHEAAASRMLVTVAHIHSDEQYTAGGSQSQKLRIHLRPSFLGVGPKKAQNVVYR
ncbi:MAG: hypothetical protein C3F02_02380 [Parcubacteria group bacterium]|nr:MAG: hypothetical protein C3F02_02380 [Parcubacteria group bacterium]